MKSLKKFNRRVFLYMGIISLAFIVLVWRLYTLQLAEGRRYRTLSERNRLRISLISPSRGIIVDSTQTVLARGRRVFQVYITRTKIPDMLHSLQKLQQILDISNGEIEEILHKAKNSRSNSRILIREDLTWNQVSRIYINKMHLRDVYISQGEWRKYFYKDAYAHVIGYVGKVSRKDTQNEHNPLLLIPGFSIGKSGLEKGFENILRGQAGTRQSEYNSRGYKLRDLQENTVLPISGDTISLTIHNKLQNYIYKLLKSYKSASVVVMDIHTGAVKAMVSQPSYDPNLFVGGISHKDWQSIRNNPYRPLVNKCVAGLYAPASTFKMIVALAGLKAGVSKRYNVYCKGSIEMFGKDIYCWLKTGHGKVDIVKSLSRSCDIWYYQISQKVGIDNIAKMARILGLGEQYNFGLETEKSGLIPNKAWKRRVKNKPWYKGETVNASIGQGDVLTTPIQLAVMTARLVNGGYAVVPHLTHMNINGERPPTEFPRIDIDRSHIELIKKGMYNAVNSPTGTAHKLQQGSWRMGGKTGTGQLRSISAKERELGVTKNEDREWKYRDNALFVGYAPVRNPRFAISVIVEHGGSGSSVAAPIARKIFNYMARLKDLDTPKTPSNHNSKGKKDA